MGILKRRTNMNSTRRTHFVPGKLTGFGRIAQNERLGVITTRRSRRGWLVSAWSVHLHGEFSSRFMHYEENDGYSYGRFDS
jgi:hypothetical protein